MKFQGHIALFLFTFLHATDTVRADVGGAWRRMAALTTPRQELGAARIGGAVYVAGGLLTGPSIQATATVERYDIAGNTWSFVAPIPAPRDHAGVCALNGELYVIGGYGGDFVPKSDVWKYTPGTNTWTPRASLPAARGACWAVAHGGKIYVFGGTTLQGTISRTTFIYDPVSNGWTTGVDMPTAREHLSAASLGAFIYVVGGRDGSGSFDLNERYDPAFNTWATLAPMPSARSAAGVTGFESRLFVMGGEVPVLSAKNEVFDPVTGLWSAQEPMPLPRHGIAAIALDDRIFVPAGGTVQGLGPTASADAFLPLPANARHACTCASSAPCGNTAIEAGCRNSLGIGAELTAIGRASIGADSLVLIGKAMPSTTSVLYFQGTTLINAGTGSFFGDGLRCAGGTVIRLGIKTNASGSSSYPEPGDLPISLRGLVPAGATRHYQAWYRNLAGPCGQGFNLTNAISVDW